MEFLKNVFGDKALTFAEFSQAVEADGKIKLINLADGGYVAKEKLDKKITELSEAQATIETLKGNGEDVEKLRQTILDYETKEKNRADAEAKAKEFEALKARFDPLKKDNKFLNEGTEKWMFEEFSKALTLEENKGKSDTDIYEAIAKDKNIYENPNSKFVNPSANGGKDTDKTEFKRFF